ncbi:MAG: hypothetical protein K2J81_07440 [Treponemataceae bacterium]|nr:hypothetical protein [Treponemataceae bacterium]
MGMTITKQDLEQAQERIQSRIRQDSVLCKELILARPKNGGADIADIAIKIAAVDITNETHLSSARETFFLQGLAAVIRDTEDIDGRIERGDGTLVADLSRKIKDEFGYNAFPFVSKYCSCHNRFVYGKSDFSVYDSRVHAWLLEYYKGTPVRREINKFRNMCDYVAFNSRMWQVIVDNSLTDVEAVRTKLDGYISVVAGGLNGQA